MMSCVQLTPRQREALDALSRGLTYEEVARELGVGRSTVRTHVHKAYRRLGAVDRTTAVLEYLRPHHERHAFRRRAAEIGPPCRESVAAAVRRVAEAQSDGPEATAVALVTLAACAAEWASALVPDEELALLGDPVRIAA